MEDEGEMRRIDLQEEEDSAPFAFQVGDVVLVAWEDEKIYYAKLSSIDHQSKTCRVVFEDDSVDTALFSQIHGVMETFTPEEIVCCKCGRGESSPPNQIVLCDKCQAGFHQRCHRPTIDDRVIEENVAWYCTYCETGKRNPYVRPTKNPFAQRSRSTQRRRSVTSGGREKRRSESFPATIAAVKRVAAESPSAKRLPSIDERSDSDECSAGKRLAGYEGRASEPSDNVDDAPPLTENEGESFGSSGVDIPITHPSHETAEDVPGSSCGEDAPQRLAEEDDHDGLADTNGYEEEEEYVIVIEPKSDDGDESGSYRQTDVIAASQLSADSPPGLQAGRRESVERKDAEEPVHQTEQPSVQRAVGTSISDNPRPVQQSNLQVVRAPTWKPDVLSADEMAKLQPASGRSAHASRSTQTGSEQQTDLVQVTAFGAKQEGPTKVHARYPHQLQHGTAPVTTSPSTRHALQSGKATAQPEDQSSLPQRMQHRPSTEVIGFSVRSFEAVPETNDKAATVWSKRQSRDDRSSSSAPSVSVAQQSSSGVAALGQPKRFKPRIITEDSGEYDYGSVTYQPMMGYITAGGANSRRHWNVISSHRWQQGSGVTQAMYNCYTTYAERRIGKQHITPSMDFDYLQELFDQYHTHLTTRLTTERQERQANRHRHNQHVIQSHLARQDLSNPSENLPLLESAVAAYKKSNFGSGLHEQSTVLPTSDEYESKEFYSYNLGRQQRYTHVSAEQSSQQQPVPAQHLQTQHLKPASTMDKQSTNLQVSRYPQQVAAAGGAYPLAASASYIKGNTSKQASYLKRDMVVVQANPEGHDHDYTTLAQLTYPDQTASRPRQARPDPPPYPHHLFAERQGQTNSSSYQEKRQSATRATVERVAQAWGSDINQPAQQYRIEAGNHQRTDSYHRSEAQQQNVKQWHSVYQDGSEAAHSQRHAAILPQTAHATTYNKLGTTHQSGSAVPVAMETIQSNLESTISRPILMPREQTIGYYSQEKPRPVQQYEQTSQVDSRHLQTAQVSGQGNYSGQERVSWAQHQVTDAHVDNKMGYSQPAAQGVQKLSLWSTPQNTNSNAYRARSQVRVQERTAQQDPVPIAQRTCTQGRSTHQSWHEPVQRVAPNTMPQQQFLGNQLAGTQMNIASSTGSRTVVVRPLHMQESTPASTTKNSVCVNCGAEARLKCSVCTKIWYCSKECQMKSWKKFCWKCDPKVKKS